MAPSDDKSTSSAPPADDSAAAGAETPDQLGLARERIAALLTDHGPATVNSDGTVSATVAGVPVTITVAQAPPE